MRLATRLGGLSLTLSLLITGAGTAFAETPTPDVGASPSATATSVGTPTETVDPSESASVAPSASANERGNSGEQPTAGGVAPAAAPAPIFRPYCNDLSQLITPEAMKDTTLTKSYLGAPVAVGQVPDVLGFVPRQGALFNNPTTEARTVVIKQMLDAVRSAKSGEVVRIAMYSMSRWDSAKAVIRAHCRGVNIQYLTDDHGVGTFASQAVKKTLGAPESGSAFKACFRSCSSDHTWRAARLRVVTTTNPLYRPYMHAKYLTFDTLAGVPYVSLASSGNFTSTQVKNGWNNIYTIVRDKTTFDFLNNRFVEMWADTSGNDYAARTSTVPTNKTTYFFPWAVAQPTSSAQTVNPATDPYTSFLENVKCTGMAKGYGNSKRKTQVLVSMYQWTSSRLYLARRLKTLKNRGCEVKVLMSASEWDLEVMPILRKWDAKKKRTTYKHGNISIRNGDRGSRFIHSKFILVNGKWGGDTKAQMVFTGSGNWTKSSLRFNNELNVLVRNSVIYSQFKANWNKLWGSKKYSVPITKLSKKKTTRGDA